MRRSIFMTVASVFIAFIPSISFSQETSQIVDFFKRTKRASIKITESIYLDFETHHPQGLTKVGEFYFMSTVKIIERTIKFDSPAADFELDRTQGRGIGYLLKFDNRGKLIAQTEIGDPRRGIYHPGGIDFDGSFLWVPVAEYRPYSRSIIYKVSPHDLKIEKVFEVNDHIGGVVYNRKKDTVHGVSWGSRWFYTWSNTGNEIRKTVNGGHYIDYQDCQYVHVEKMLCSGMVSYNIPEIGKIALGGIDLIDLNLEKAIHQIPIVEYPNDRNLEVVLTRNPMFAEVQSGSDNIVFYFVPEDSTSTLYTAEVNASN